MSKDTKPTPKPDDTTLKKAAQYTTNSILAAINIVNRQFWSISELLFTGGKNPYKELKNDPNIVAKNLGPRAMQQLAVVPVSLAVAKSLEDRDDPSSLFKLSVAAASTIEACGSSVLEPIGAKAALRKSLGKDILTPRDFLNISKHTAGPLQFRAYPVWYANLSKEEDPRIRALHGAIAGIVSGPASSYANILMMNSSPAKSMSENYFSAFNIMRKLGVATITMSSLYRLPPCFIAANIFSPKTGEMIQKNIVNPIFDKFDRPSSSTQNPLSKKLKAENESYVEK